MFGGGFNFSNVSSNAVPPAGAVTAANNGTSKNPANTVVLGQDLAEPGDPAALLSTREIPVDQFNIELRGGSSAGLTDRISLIAGAMLNIQARAFTGTQFPAPGMTLTDLDNSEFTEVSTGYNGALEAISLIRNRTVFIELFPVIPGVSISPNAYQVQNPNVFFDVTGNSRLNGWTITAKPVNTSASPVSVNPDESRTVYANLAAGLKVINLPGSFPGQVFSAYVGHTDGVEFNPQATDTIRIAGAVGAAGAPATSTTVGDYLELTCIASGEWVATSVVGVGWTV